MAYQALYRKWRPSNFDEVRGQDHIVTTLKNQIEMNRIGHAYLFCGTRGTGKTTVAKILAKAVNCEHPIDGNPCNECETCKAIAAGNSMNVIEIDAASNNGVDNIREIREEVAYSPTSGKYKVYIIDEVHMLSIGAFNALLKTLEEPPSYVIFILATTEAHKIPITILSRCQRYDFKRIARTTIVDRLRELMDEEQVEVEDKALRYIAKKGDGSMRDALSLLDQCIAFYLGEKLTYEHVLDVLGAVDTDEFSKLLREVLDGDVTQVILHLENMIMQGRDLTQLVNDFTWYLRNLLLLKSSDNMEDVLDVSAENLEQLKEEAAMVRDDTLMRYIRIFSELSNQLRYASQKRVMVEVALIKLTRPSMEPDLDSVLQRLKQLEAAVEDLEAGGFRPGTMVTAPMGAVPVTAGVQPQISGTQGQMAVPVQGGPTGNPPETAGAAGITPPNQVSLPPAQLEDLNLIRNEWAKIIRSAGGSARACFRDTVVEPGGEGCLTIVFLDSMSYDMGRRPTVIGQLEQLVQANYGKSIYFKTRLAGRGERLDTIYVTKEDLEDKIHMDITYED